MTPRTGPVGRPRGDAVATRTALIEGTIATLHEAGFAGASARQIAHRAGCNQALIFYHFGSVRELLLAALDEISSRRMSAYRDALERAASISDLVTAARAILTRDLELGYAGVLLEMINAAHTVVAGLLGLEMLALLDGDHRPALAILDRASQAARLLVPLLGT